MIFGYFSHKSLEKSINDNEVMVWIGNNNNGLYLHEKSSLNICQEETKLNIPAALLT